MDKDKHHVISLTHGLQKKKKGQNKNKLTEAQVRIEITRRKAGGGRKWVKWVKGVNCINKW